MKNRTAKYFPSASYIFQMPYCLVRIDLRKRQPWSMLGWRKFRTGKFADGNKGNHQDPSGNLSPFLIPCSGKRWAIHSNQTPRRGVKLQFNFVIFLRKP